MFGAILVATVLFAQGAPAAAATPAGSSVSPVTVTGVKPPVPAKAPPDELV